MYHQFYQLDIFQELMESQAQIPSLKANLDFYHNLFLFLFILIFDFV